LIVHICGPKKRRTILQKASKDAAAG